ncbi:MULTISPECIES: hypothetical protein [Rhizobium]|uniref:hypothetical protein n=1 Tax=Rhizobium sp. SEMIA 4085 TaxID=2137761 RepID=UPI000587C2CB|nr:MULTISPECIES: hypothetical protein [Rhizobium]
MQKSPSWLILSKILQHSPLHPGNSGALENAVIAKSLRQVASAPTATGHPEDGVNKASVIGSPAALAAAATGHQGRKKVPLGFITGSRSSYTADLSSKSILNPICTHSKSIVPSSARGLTNNATLLNDFQKL